MKKKTTKKQKQKNPDVEYYCSKLDSYPTLSSHWLPLFCSSLFSPSLNHIFSNLSLAHLIFIPSHFYPFFLSSFYFHFCPLIKVCFFPACATPPSSSYAFCFLWPLPILMPSPVWSRNCNLNKKKMMAIKERHDEYCVSVFAFLSDVICDCLFFLIKSVSIFHEHQYFPSVHLYNSDLLAKLSVSE